MKKREGCPVDGSPCCFIDLDLMRLRIAQIEQRINARHPRAAKDGELMAFIRSLRDDSGLMDEYGG